VIVINFGKVIAIDVPGNVVKNKDVIEAYIGRGASEPDLEVKNLSVLYDRAIVLNGLSLHVNSGETGKPGSRMEPGRAPLLNAMSGLIKWQHDTLKGTVSGKLP